MDKTKSTDAELLAAFVAAARDAGAFIERIERADWLADLRSQLPKPYPALFDAFLSSYCFVPFDFSGVTFFGNSGENDHDDLHNAVVRDQCIFDGTVPYGFLQFGRPEDGSYDPICFDLNHGNRDDAPIVRLDHEAILCDYSVSICSQIASSFREFTNARTRNVK